MGWKMDFTVPLSCPTCDLQHAISIRSLSDIDHIDCPCGQLLLLDNYSPGFHDRLGGLCEIIDQLEVSLNKIVQKAKNEEMGSCQICKTVQQLPAFNGLPIAMVCDTCPEHHKDC